MAKYNKTAEVPKTKLMFESISKQLSKDNKKFQYKLLKSGGRTSLYEDAIKWICSADICSQLFRVKHISPPLECNKSIDGFKLYMNDVGL